MAEKSRRSRRRKKSSRYLPLLWIVTGALIALFLVFSGNLVVDLPKATEDDPAPSAQPSQQNNLPETNQPLARRLYLVRQMDRGVRLVSHAVTLAPSTAPLQSTLEALLAFRQTDDLNVIPPDTKLRRVWVKDGYAHIDLSEDFAYNAYGVQGYKLQVYQIVLTACQFAHIKGVYFYLEGAPLRYLGGEGFIVPRPVLPPRQPFELPY